MMEQEDVDLRHLESKESFGLDSSPGSPSGNSYRAHAGRDDFLEDETVPEGGAITSTIREWLEDVSKPDVTCALGSEVEIRRKFLFRKRYYFTVRTRVVESGDVTMMKRKYKEFKRLQEVLQERFTGALVPPLPKPSVPIEKQIEGLDLFIGEVAKNPIFRSDPAFKEFVSTGRKKFNMSCTKQLDPSSQGLLHWAQVLDSVPLPYDSNKTIQTLHKEVSSLQSMYTKIRDHIKKVQAYINRQAKDEGEVVSFYENWMKQETTFTHLFGRATDPTETWDIQGDSINMPTILINMQRISEGKVKTLERESSELEVQQSVNEIELAYLGELLEMVTLLRVNFKKHKQLMEDAASTRAQIESNLAKQQGGGGNNTPTPSPKPPTANNEDDQDANTDDGKENDSNAENTKLVSPPPSPLPKNHLKLEKKLADLEKQIKEKQIPLKREIRGVLFEVNRYRFERTARASKSLYHLADVQNTHLHGNAEICQHALDTTPREVPPVSHLACVINYSHIEPTLSLVDDEVNVVRKVKSPSKRHSSRVLYDFQAEEQGEVNLREGELVEVIEEDVPDSAGWCKVRLEDGSLGLAPISYIETDEGGAPPDPSIAKAHQAQYGGGGDDDDDDDDDSDDDDEFSDHASAKSDEHQQPLKYPNRPMSPLAKEVSSTNLPFEEIQNAEIVHAPSAPPSFLDGIKRFDKSKLCHKV